MLKSRLIATPLGALTAVADEEKLYSLEFTEEPPSPLPSLLLGWTAPLKLIEKELNLYFKGNLTEFTTPLFMQGTLFQKKVWETLRTIPYGESISYLQLAEKVGKPSAYRAAANANGANRFIIIVPCHRVMNANGKLGGYSAGIDRKKWLLNHEHS